MHRLATIPCCGHQPGLEDWAVRLAGDAGARPTAGPPMWHQGLGLWGGTEASVASAVLAGVTALCPASPSRNPGPRLSEGHSQPLRWPSAESLSPSAPGQPATPAVSLALGSFPPLPPAQPASSETSSGSVCLVETWGQITRRPAGPEGCSQAGWGQRWALSTHLSWLPAQLTGIGAKGEACGQFLGSLWAGGKVQGAPRL